ncbi:YdeI/OmpD-associated family protein [Nocardia lijiangensis]|uniref:YdeI/OmpD-associated family protein n=1 Tax=Nocardia lijiangensis TaxID=299618 RepID=UPI000A0002E8|nr:YdeI/OmpD-associated family protein [Nocardia lijiangensis]
MNDTEIYTFTDSAHWESWLEANYDGSTGVWLKIAKKHAAGATITITEALDGALCYGWIDSHRRGLDDDHYLQRYSPRRPKSPWSQVNVGKVEALIAAGRLREPGWAAVRAARADGRWSAAYEPQRSATVPADLSAALAGNPRAHKRFEELDRTGRYALLLQLMKTRTDAERAARLGRIIDELERAAC